MTDALTCKHRWITAGGERRDSCGECGVFATEVLATLTQRLAAAEEARDQLSAALSVVNAQKAAAEGERDRVVQQYEQRVREYNDEWRKNQADLQRVRGALERAIAEIREHNAEYQHRTPDRLIDEWAALTGPATGGE